MSFYTPAPTVTVQIDAENSVVLRRLSFGETQEVVGESTVFDMGARTGRLDFSKHQVARLSRAIVSWDGPGFEGRPVSRENIAALPTWVGDKLARAVEEINTGLAGDEQKN